MIKLGRFCFLMFLITFISTCSEEKIALEDTERLDINDAIEIWQQREISKPSEFTRQYENVNPLWEKHASHLTENGVDYISIPLQYQDKKLIKLNGQKVNADLAAYLLFLKRDNKSYLYHIEVVKDTENSGAISVFNLNGEFVKGYRFSNDNYIPITINKNNTESGSSSVYCYYIDYYTCTVRSSGPDDCYYDYSLLHCELTQDEPPSLFDNGAGAGGDDGPSLIDPVECENDSSDGVYYLDSEGNCVRVCEEGLEIDENGECSPPVHVICNKHIAFDQIPMNDGEMSFTGELLALRAAFRHTRTGEFYSPLIGSVCITYGTSTLVNSALSANVVVKQAYELALIETEAWLNSQEIAPGYSPTTNYFLNQFRIANTFLANAGPMQGTNVWVSSGPCLGSVSRTLLRYCPK